MLHTTQPVGPLIGVSILTQEGHPLILGKPPQVGGSALRQGRARVLFYQVVQDSRGGHAAAGGEREGVEEKGTVIRQMHVKPSHCNTQKHCLHMYGGKQNI